MNTELLLKFFFFYVICNPLFWMVAISTVHQIRNPKAKDEYDQVRRILAEREKNVPFFKWPEKINPWHLAKMVAGGILVYLVLNWWYT